MGFSPTPLPATPPENIHIASCSLRQRKTRRFWLECLILRVSECQGDCFLCLFGCKKTTSCCKMKKKKENDSYLSDFFDLWASFANQWATLAPRENQAKCHRWLACHVAVCHCCGNILREISKICCFSVSTVRNISVIWQVFLCVCACCDARLEKRCSQCLSCFWAYLFKLLRNHGKGSKDALCRSCDGDYPLRGRALWYVDASATLEAKPRSYSSCDLIRSAWQREIIRPFTLQMSKQTLTSSLIFLTVSPFWNQAGKQVGSIGFIRGI